MNEIMKIIRINTYIQRKLGTVTLDGKEVLCVALDRSAAVEGGDGELALSEEQVEALYQQTV